MGRVQKTISDGLNKYGEKVYRGKILAYIRDIYGNIGKWPFSIANC